jgi:hypothetical protein
MQEKKTGNHSRKKFVDSSEYNIRCAYIFKRFASQAKGSGDEDSEEKDELPDDGEDEDKVLSIGDLLPTVTLKNEKDEDVNVAEIAAEKGLILFLVPKADTRQSTLQLWDARFLDVSRFF